jgi:tetratricopeptide (TPR) repeat protein
MNTSRVAVVLAFVLASAVPVPRVQAQVGVAEVQGAVTDAEGNPLEGVGLVFSNPAAPKTVYEVKTSKKGRYYLGNLLYYPNSSVWTVKIQADGYVPIKVRADSRTQAATVDKFERELTPGQELPKIQIGAFGKVLYDVVMAKAAQLQVVVGAGPEPSAAEAAEVLTGTAGTAGQAPDSWNAALTAATGGDLEGSVPLFEKAVSEAPEDPERRTAFAKVLYQLARYPEATRQAMKAAELAPNSVEPQLLLYRGYQLTHDRTGAGAALDRARAIAPEDIRVLSEVAVMAQQGGDRAQAIEAYEAITRLDPSDAEAWLALGALYAEAGQLGKSAGAYEKVSSLSPESAHQAFFNLGALLLNRSHPTEADKRRAADAFRHAVELKPDYAAAHQQLGFALLGLGDVQGARLSLERYVELVPGAADAKQMKALLEQLKR